MTATSAPFGFVPVLHPSGIVRPHVLIGGIASGFATAIYLNQPVRIDPSTRKVIAIAATSVDLCGTFAGVEWVDTTGRPRISPFWTASTTALTNTLVTAIVNGYDQPDLEYEIQADGSVAITGIGDETTFTNLTANSAGFSQCTASATLVGSGVQGQLSILDRGLQVDNDWGDAYTILRTKIARHQYAAVKVAI